MIAASVLAANAVLRSCFGAAFPLFTTYMYRNLGIHWASSIPAFLALLCVPFPFVLYKYGPAIRKRCKYAAEAAAFMERIRGATAQAQQAQATKAESNTSDEADKLELDAEQEKQQEEQPNESTEAFDYNYENDEPSSSNDRFKQIKPGTSNALHRTSTNISTHYEGNPFDLDRVATKDSFAHERRSQSVRRLSLRSTKSNKSMR